MNILRTIALVLFIIGVLGLFIPSLPGAEFIRYAIIIGIVLLVVEVVTGRRA